MTRCRHLAESMTVGKAQDHSDLTLKTLDIENAVKYFPSVCQCYGKGSYAERRAEQLAPRSRQGNPAFPAEALGEKRNGVKAETRMLTRRVQRMEKRGSPMERLPF
jgi:hypothetical protein